MGSLQAALSVLLAAIAHFSVHANICPQELVSLNNSGSVWENILLAKK